MSLKIESVLFDLDGVLLDSEGAYSKFWNAMDSLYPTGVVNFPQIIKGTTLPDILNKYFAQEYHEDIIRRGRIYEQSMSFPLFDGAVEAIRSLHELNIPCAIVTSSMEDKMERLAAQYPDFFSLFAAVITGSDVVKSKPDPEGYLLAARLLGARPERSVVVEDSLQGMQAGRSAGSFVVGISATIGRAVTVANADIVIDKISEFDINKCLRQFNKRSEPL